MQKLNKEIQDELDEGLYDNKCSDVCAWCDKPMSYDMDRYVVRGNQCAECSAITNHAMDRRPILKANLSQIKANKLRKLCGICRMNMLEGICIGCDDNEVSVFRAKVTRELPQCERSVRKNKRISRLGVGVIADEATKLAEKAVALEMYKKHRKEIDKEVDDIVQREIEEMQKKNLKL